MEYFQVESCGRTLRGCVSKGGASDNKTLPLIIVHGYFSANRNGPQRLFVELAECLSRMGYAVYRFDLSGMGESGGNIADIKFDDHVNDVKTMLQYVKSKHIGKKINILAHSLGCNLVLAALKQQSHVVDKIVFLAPFITNDQTLINVFGQDGKRELIEKSYTIRRGLYADVSYFKSSTETEFIGSVNSAAAKIYMLIANDDQFIPIDLTKAVVAEIKNADVCFVDNADHNFLELHSRVKNTIAEIFETC